MYTFSIIMIIVFLILAPILGGFIAGVDRIITARMQGRVGPPVRQPFYDVLKLFGKENLVVNRFHVDYVACSLIFTVLAGAIFFGGANLLLAVFAMIVGGVFIVLAAYCTNSPYALIGAERELLQMLAAEPMILLAPVGLYMATGSFNVYEIAAAQHAPIFHLPGVYIALCYVFTIKLRKSPFDLSTSHHGHQELVKGLTTEFAGPSLAVFEITHWYETIFMLAMLFLFFGSHWFWGIIITVLVYLSEIFIDNINARIKWELMLASAWGITIILGVGNLLVLFFINKL